MAPTWLTKIRALSTVKSKLPTPISSRLNAGVAAVTAATLVGGGVAFAVLPAIEPQPIAAVPNSNDAALGVSALDLAQVDVAARSGVSRASRDSSRPALTPAALSAEQQAAVNKGGVLSKITPAGKPGSAWTTTSLRVRSEASAEGKEVAVLSEGTQVTTTGWTNQGWTEIELDGKNRWVSGEYLTTKAPVVSPKSSGGSTKSSGGSSTSGGSQSAGRDDGPAATGGSGSCRSQLSGLTSAARTLHNAICANYPSISSYGGVRSDWYPAHPSGRAIDAMIPNWSSSSGNALGWSLAKWLRANAGRFGIAEIIFDQQIWTAQRSGDGWRTMSDRGSANANHRNHVHVAVR